MPRSLLLPWVVALCSWPPLASALPPPPGQAPSEAAVVEANQLLEEGRMHRRRGHFEEAERVLTRAWTLAALPEALLDLSAVYRAVGRISEAIEALRAYLALRPEDPHAETLRARLRTMERLFARRGDDPPDHRVAHQVSPNASREGRGEDRPRGTRSTAASAPRSDEQNVDEVGEEGDTGRRSSAIPWITLGASGLLGALAGVTGVLALDAEAELEARCTPVEDGRWVCPDPSYVGWKARGALLATTTDVLAAIAVLGAGASLALYLFETNEEEARTLRLAGGCSSEACAANLEVRF